MLNFVKADFAKAFFNGLAKNNDTKTTVIGIITASIVATDCNWSKAVQGDSNELAKLAVAALVALLGYYTNKHTPPQKPA